MFGNSTAGGAYVPGMCDYAVLVDEQAKVFLGGPPLVKMATGEDADDEELGGAEMHTRVSGLSRLLRRRRARRDPHRPRDRRPAQLAQARPGTGPAPAPPRYDPEEILGIVSADLKVPFDPREVLARVVDDSEFDEYKPLYGTYLVTGWARSCTAIPSASSPTTGACCSARRPRRRREFILLANQMDTPLVFLQNITGYMVGTSYEQGGHHQGRRQDDQRRRQQHRART